MTHTPMPRSRLCLMKVGFEQFISEKKGKKKKRIKAQADSVSLAILVKPVVENLKSRCGNVITDWKV